MKMEKIESMGVQEMNTLEMRETDGGGLFIIMAITIFALGVLVELLD